MKYIILISVLLSGCVIEKTKLPECTEEQMIERKEYLKKCSTVTLSSIVQCKLNAQEIFYCEPGHIKK